MNAENNHVKDSPEFPSVLAWVFLTSVLHKRIVQVPTNTESSEEWKLSKKLLLQ